MRKKSLLSVSPKSKIIRKGYMNIYSRLNPREERYIYYNNLFKKNFPDWDNTLIELLEIFKGYKQGLKNSRFYRKKRLVVLDAGCGNGNYIIDEARRDIDWAVGIDLDKVSVAKNICLDEIVIGDLNNMPFKDSSFDVVISLWVLEHLDEPERTISEIYRMLKPKGIFLFATPNKNFFLINAKKLLEKIKLDRVFTLFLYGRKKKDIFSTFYKANSVSTLKALFEKAGFSKVNIKENFDSGYTSFSNITFCFSRLLYFLSRTFKASFLKAHIYGEIVR